MTKEQRLIELQEMLYDYERYVRNASKPGHYLKNIKRVELLKQLIVETKCQ